MTETRECLLTEDELVAAQRSSFGNRGQLAGRCGCFYCLSTFTPDRVVGWGDDGTTALCPVCGIDAVLSSATAAVNDQALQQMRRRWFDTSFALNAAGWEPVAAAGPRPPP